MFGKCHENEKAQDVVVIITALRCSAQHAPTLALETEGAVSISGGGDRPCFTLAFRRDWEIFDEGGLTCALSLVILSSHGSDPTGILVSGSVESTEHRYRLGLTCWRAALQRGTWECWGTTG